MATATLTAFTISLFAITANELGDKTFCIAMLLAMRHSRRMVFLGAGSALMAMTLLSVELGRLLRLFPPQLVQGAMVLLFLGFGIKLLVDAWRMPPTHRGCDAGEAEEAIQQAKSLWGFRPGIVMQAFGLTFMAELGDRTQFATIALAAKYDAWGVTAGSIAGHWICAAIAVLGGRYMANHISERLLTALSGGLFIAFGIAALFTTNG
jgi:Ca2+/H+ antiporter, TMEM165/GDT1 family